MTRPPPSSVAAAERLSRLLALVPWLVAHDGVTVEAAAEHFEVTPEDLTADLWLLVCSGLPGYGPGDLVDIQFWDEGGRIHVIDPQTLRRPLRLSPDEAMSLLVALRLLAQVPGDHDRAALDSATAKLEQAAGTAAADADRVRVDVEVPPDLVPVLDGALRDGRALRLTYAGAARDEATERVVDPMRMLVVEGRTYLEGWCRRAEAVRTFRLDRVLTATVLDEPARPPVDAAPTDLDAAGLRPAGSTVTVDLAPAAAWVADAHPVETVTPTPDGGLRVVLAVGEPDWVVRLMLRLGGAARVVEPPEIVEAVRSAAAAALAAYDPG